MFEISETLDKRLKEMDFVDYLQYMHDRLENISHRPKTNTAYSECRTLTLHIKHRIVTEFKLSWEDFDIKIGKNLRQSEEILDLYGHSESDKRKSARIKEFVDEYTYDLSSFIKAAKRRKENPNTTIGEEEI
jgi:hypothetical protein